MRNIMGKDKNESGTEVTETAEVTHQTRERKLTRSIDGTVVKFVEATTGSELTYDFASLPADIQAKLGPYGLNQKLGDAAAGKSGQEAIDAIAKVFTALQAGDWSFRAPAAAKVTVADIKTKLEGMTDAERDMASQLLAKLGVKM
jgi:hypothetical protein